MPPASPRQPSRMPSEASRSPRRLRSGCARSPATSDTKPTRSRGRWRAGAAAWSGSSGPSLEDLWQQRFVAEAGRALLDHDRYALILDAGGDPERQRLLAAQLRDQQVDGLILSPVDPSDSFWIEPGRIGGGRLHRRRTRGGRRRRRGVVRQPHRRHPARSSTCMGSGTGASSCCARPRRRRPIARPRSWSPPRGHGSAWSWKSSAPATSSRRRPRSPARSFSSDEHATAAFCFSDSIAYGVYAAARSLGLRIPDELSVIGYDDHPVSALLAPPLTSFDWDSDRVVEVAVGMTLGAIDGRRRRRRVLIEPRLEVRGSTAAPAGG